MTTSNERAPDWSPDWSFEESLAAAQAGDQQAMNDLFGAFYPRVRQIVHRSLATDLRQGRGWLASRFSTGDVVQEVFWSVLGDLKAFGGKSERAFVGFLAMVIRNRIIDAIRYHEAERRDGRRRGENLDEALHSSEEATPLEAVVSLEQSERYQEALAEFPEREQLLLRARLEDTATFEELAVQLGYSHESSARRAYYAAMARLTIRLRAEDEEAAS
ncbi:MAG: sigma-70 family RNA polymerase sigma factor [Planctomycetota bacterium]